MAHRIRRRRLAEILAFGLAVSAAGPLVLAGGTPNAPKAAREETALLELGRRLFFDPSVDRTGTRSCADCHDPEHGFSDEAKVSRDSRGPTPRHAQTLIDCSLGKEMHWDGKFASVEAVITERIAPSAGEEGVSYYGQAPAEPQVERDADGHPALQLVSRAVRNSALPAPRDAIQASERYHTAFFAAFQSPDVTDARIAGAIAAYVTSIRSGESPYDRYSRGDYTALSASAKRGLALFRGSGGCAACHSMDGARAEFTDHRMHDLGIRTIPPPPSAVGLPSEVPPTVPRPDSLGFKTATLRDVARRGPYMHNGNFDTLESVVRFFLTKYETRMTADPCMPSYQATDAEVADLVEFLRSLSSGVRPGTPREAWTARAAKTRLQFVDADEKPLANWNVALAPAGDSLPRGEKPVLLRLKTDRDGWVAYVPPATTHVRLVFPGGLRPEGGCWIPDTCREAKIAIPIRGMGRVWVECPAGSALPERLELEHVSATFFPDRRAPRTTLVREGSVEAGGRAMAIYAGWIRTDVSRSGFLLVPPNLAANGHVAAYLVPAAHGPNTVYLGE